MPRSLIRDLDGRSVYTRPGITRYATRGQLAMEERMCQQAQRHGAPALTREFCAAQLGADADTLDAQLGARAQDATAVTHTGLRMDQAAMIYEALTSDAARLGRSSARPGSGKTHTVAAGAKAWEADRRQGHRARLRAGRPRRAGSRPGSPTSYNTTQFLLRIERGLCLSGRERCSSSMRARWCR